MMKNADKPAMPTTSLTMPNGLTKREWFAGLAMQGLCANPAGDEMDDESRAVVSVAIADALLAELEPTQ